MRERIIELFRLKGSGALLTVFLSIPFFQLLGGYDTVGVGLGQMIYLKFSEKKGNVSTK